MDEELTKTLKYLRLSWLRANLDRVLDTAVKGNFSHLRLLKWIMEEEYRLKKENSRNLRLRRARIPERLLLETFPFENQARLDKKKIINLYDRFDYICKNRNIIWLGPTGVGKNGPGHGLFDPGR